MSQLGFDFSSPAARAPDVGARYELRDHGTWRVLRTLGDGRVVLRSEERMGGFMVMEPERLERGPWCPVYE